MKKKAKGTKLRLDAEAVRMLSGDDMKTVAAGCANNSCELGTVSRIETRIRPIY